MRRLHAIIASAAMVLLTSPAFAEDQTRPQGNFASDGGLGTTRIQQDCEGGAGNCTRFGSGWAGDAHVRGGDCDGGSGCSGFASDGGLGTTRIRDED